MERIRSRSFEFGKEHGQGGQGRREDTERTTHLSFLGWCSPRGLLDIVRGSPTFCRESLKLLKGFWYLYRLSTLDYVVAEFRYISANFKAHIHAL